MRARYRHQLTRDDVGSRVSIRRWIEDEERGVRPSDVVGRLVAWDDRDVLTVRTRRAGQVEVDVVDILSSRVVPEHPTFPPE
ncbi:MAG: hypothetical protein KY461_10605 [Actinobacteria bacterium]|nr:hypothetical protein [Actinomycetota bacterium]